MTDARLPDPWLGNPRFGCLSDASWRLFTHALMWSNRYGTDGVVDKKFYPHLLVEGDTIGQVLELMDCEIAIPTAGGFAIPWEQFGQSFAADVERTRLLNRQRKAKQREREQMLVPYTIASRDVTRDNMREVGQVRLGEEDTF